MDGSICCRNEKRVPILNLLKQYRKGLEDLLTAFNSARYATCDRLMRHLEVSISQLSTPNFQPVFAQKHGSISAEQLRIQELQAEFYERSHDQIDDLIKQAPKRTHLNRLEKFL